jgi:hypothetical protein
MKNLLTETGPSFLASSISPFTSVMWHLVKTLTIRSQFDPGITFAFEYPLTFRPFFCPRAGIGTPVALGREKLKRLQTGFDELRGNHAEE